MNINVSVVIPTYNRANTIEKTIKSILDQTYKNYEIIVVDDNSKDNTEEIIKKYIDKYRFITYVKHEKNKGGSAARNTGAKLAKGNFISFLDSDDQWIETKLEKEIECIANNPNVDMIYSNMYLVYIEKGTSVLCKQPDFDDKYYGMLCSNIIGSTSLITIKKDVFNKLGGFKEGLPSCQDWDFYLNVAGKYNLIKIDEPLLKYYIHSNSISGNLEKAIAGHKLILDKVTCVLKEDNRYKKHKNKILSYQYSNIASIYNKFKKFDEARKYYYKAFKLYPVNKFSIKNLVPMLLGEKIYYKLKY